MIFPLRISLRRHTNRNREPQSRDLLIALDFLNGTANAQQGRDDADFALGFLVGTDGNGNVKLNSLPFGKAREGGAGRVRPVDVGNLNASFSSGFHAGHNAYQSPFNERS
jgi:hypothetical protein